MHGTKSVLFLLVVLMAATWAARFFMLQKSPYAPGLDGYSYAVQTHSLKQYGKAKDPDASPVLRLLGGLARIVGDPVVSNKSGAALFAALLLLPVFLLGRRVTGSPAAGLGMAAFFSFSPSLTYLSIEFLKNLGGLVGLLFPFFTRPLLPEGKTPGGSGAGGRSCVHGSGPSFHGRSGAGGDGVGPLPPALEAQGAGAPACRGGGGRVPATGPDAGRAPFP